MRELNSISAFHYVSKVCEINLNVISVNMHVVLMTSDESTVLPKSTGEDLPEYCHSRKKNYTRKARPHHFIRQNFWGCNVLRHTLPHS